MLKLTQKVIAQKNNYTLFFYYITDYIKSQYKMKVCPQKSRKLHQSRKKYQSSRTRAEKKILLMLAFFSTSVGLWENFRQLWLQDNGYSASEISQITGLSTLVSVGAIILVGRFLRNNHLQHFINSFPVRKAHILTV